MTVAEGSSSRLLLPPRGQSLGQIRSECGGRSVVRLTVLRLGREVRLRAIGFVENKADLCLSLESMRVQMGGVCSATQVSMSRSLLVAFLTQGPQGTVIGGTFTRPLSCPPNFLFSC